MLFRLCRKKQKACMINDDRSRRDCVHQLSLSSLDDDQELVYVKTVVSNHHTLRDVCCVRPVWKMPYGTRQHTHCTWDCESTNRHCHARILLSVTSPDIEHQFFAHVVIADIMRCRNPDWFDIDGCYAPLQEQGTPLAHIYMHNLHSINIIS